MSQARTAPPATRRERLRYELRHPAHWWEAGRYAVVGISGWTLSVASFAALVVVGVPYWGAAAISFWCALVHNFLLNRHWTFKAGDSHVRVQWGRFVLVNLVLLALSIALLHLFVTGAGVPKVPAQGLAVLAVALPNFIAHKLWSFRV